MGIQEPLLMQLELGVSLPLVELSDINVIRDIDSQGPLLEHVKHQADGQEPKQTAKVGKCMQLYFISGFKNMFQDSKFNSTIKTCT